MSALLIFAGCASTSANKRASQQTRESYANPEITSKTLDKTLAGKRVMEVKATDLKLGAADDGREFAVRLALACEEEIDYVIRKERFKVVRTYKPNYGSVAQLEVANILALPIAVVNPFGAAEMIDGFSRTAGVEVANSNRTSLGVSEETTTERQTVVHHPPNLELRVFFENPFVATLRTDRDGVIRLKRSQLIERAAGTDFGVLLIEGTYETHLFTRSVYLDLSDPLP